MKKSLMLGLLCCAISSIFGAASAEKDTLDTDSDHRKNSILKAYQWIAQRPNSVLQKDLKEYTPGMENVITGLMHENLDSIKAFFDWASPDITKLQVKECPLLFYIMRGSYGPQQEPQKFKSIIAIMLKKNPEALTQKDLQGLRACDMMKKELGPGRFDSRDQEIYQIIKPD